jgi:hypothetical protein
MSLCCLRATRSMAVPHCDACFIVVITVRCHCDRCLIFRAEACVYKQLTGNDKWGRHLVDSSIVVLHPFYAVINENRAMLGGKFRRSSLLLNCHLVQLTLCVTDKFYQVILMCVAPCIFVYDYNYLHQQMHNYFFIKHTPRLHVST